MAHPRVLRNQQALGAVNYQRMIVSIPAIGSNKTKTGKTIKRVAHCAMQGVRSVFKLASADVFEQMPEEKARPPHPLLQRTQRAQISESVKKSLTREIMDHIFDINDEVIRKRWRRI